jgi:hypothetical protein
MVGEDNDLDLSSRCGWLSQDLEHSNPSSGALATFRQWKLTYAFTLDRSWQAATSCGNWHHVLEVHIPCYRKGKAQLILRITSLPRQLSSV